MGVHPKPLPLPRKHMHTYLHETDHRLHNSCEVDDANVSELAHPNRGGGNGNEVVKEWLDERDPCDDKRQWTQGEIKGGAGASVGA